MIRAQITAVSKKIHDNVYMTKQSLRAFVECTTKTRETEFVFWNQLLIECALSKTEASGELQRQKSCTRTSCPCAPALIVLAVIIK